MTSRDFNLSEKEVTRMHKHHKWLLALAMMLVLVLLTAGQVLAKSEYVSKLPADKASASCSACHSSVPALNDAGKAFAANGKKWPEAKAPAATTPAPAKDKVAAPAPAKDKAAAPAANTKVFVKAFGKTSTLTGKASGKEVLVPLRAAANLFFAQVNWDSKTKTATIKYNGKTSSITLGKSKATVDGKETALNANAQIIKGQTYVPVSFVSALFGSDLSGDVSKGFAVNAGAPGYVGSATCAQCHANKLKDWQTTRHSRMVQDAKASDTWFVSDFRTNTFFKKEDVIFTVGQGLKGGQRYVGAKDGQLMYMNATWDNENHSWVAAKPSNYTCGTCHNTGFNPKSSSWAENSISCEACHGPGAEHAKTADKTKIKNSLGNEMCSSCHGGQADQLKAMGHTDHFKNGIDGKLGASYSDSCTSCHSATVITAVRRGQTPPKLEEFKTGALKNDRDGITCAVCHSPHKNTGNENQLRKPLTETCTQCHTSTTTGPELTPGKSPKHSQKQMFQGTAIDLNVPNPKNVTCVNCHMGDGNHLFKAGTPTVTLVAKGKPYDANPCQSCHATMTAAELKEKQETIQSQAVAYQTQLKALKTKLDAAKAAGQDVTEAQILYNANYTNIELAINDGSEGVHNPALAKAILAKAKTDLAKLTTLLP